MYSIRLLGKKGLCMKAVQFVTNSCIKTVRATENLLDEVEGSLIFIVTRGPAFAKIYTSVHNRKYEVRSIRLHN